tara:strand:- start:1327 stop:2208 length:882 start_codon:yes stop_codon:yes gene_type:complete
MKNYLQADTFSPVTNQSMVTTDHQQKNMLYTKIEEIGGGEKTVQQEFSPLINNIIHIARSLTIITIIVFATMDVYQNVGCKQQYQRLSSKGASQYILFLYIFLVIFILSAETVNPMMHSAVNFGQLVIGAIFVWILFNVVAQAGEHWLVFSSPFWPGPLTMWTAILLLLSVLYILDIRRQYWVHKKQKVITPGTITTDTILRLEKIEKIIVGLIFCLIGYGYMASLFAEKSRLGKKFSLYNFIFSRLIESNEIPIWKKGTKRCSRITQQQIRKEIRDGIKNSWWHKIWHSKTH